MVVAAALIGAIIWNLITWCSGIPSSSSHALIGGLLGATLIGGGHRGDQRGCTRRPRCSSRSSARRSSASSPRSSSWCCSSTSSGGPTPATERPLPAAPGRLGHVHGLRPRLERRPEDDGHHDPGPGARPACSRRSRSRSGSSSWPPRRSRWGRPPAAGGSSRRWARKVVKLEPVHGFAAETAAATIILAASHFGHAGLHDARHLVGDHGRRRQQAGLRGALGSRRANRRGPGS